MENLKKNIKVILARIFQALKKTWITKKGTNKEMTNYFSNYC